MKSRNRAENKGDLRSNGLEVSLECELPFASAKRKLPWVSLVLSSLSGANQGDLPPTADRKIETVDEENFDCFLSSQKPRLVFTVKNVIKGEGNLEIDVTFSALADFHPDQLVRRIGAEAEEVIIWGPDEEDRGPQFRISQEGPISRRLGQQVASLDDLTSERVASILGVNPSELELDLTPDSEESRRHRLRIEKRGPLAVLLDQRAALSDQLSGTGGKSTGRNSASVSQRAGTLASEGDEGTVSSDPGQDDPSGRVGGLFHWITQRKNGAKATRREIEKIDRCLSQQLNLILHHPDFQSLEGHWRGVHHLVRQSGSGDSVKIKVLNLSKGEFSRQIKNKLTGRDHCHLVRQICEEPFSHPGGEPIGVIIADYQFSAEERDVESLREIAQICAAGTVPFVASASSRLLGFESWSEVDGEPTELGAVQGSPQFAAWRSLRDREYSRYLGLSLPRVLARSHDGASEAASESFAFKEEVKMSEPSGLSWFNAAFAIGAMINRSFQETGWVGRIGGLEGGGCFKGLSDSSRSSGDGGGLVERSFSGRREAELCQLGLIPLTALRNCGEKCFSSMVSLRRPSRYVEDDASQNEILSCRLPVLLACCRVIQYLRSMVGEWASVSPLNVPELEEWLNGWLQRHLVAQNVDSEEGGCRRPLVSGKVTVKAPKGHPEKLEATVFLQPRFQLENLTAPFRFFIEF